MVLFSQIGTQASRATFHHGRVNGGGDLSITVVAVAIHRADSPIGEEHEL